MARYGGEANAGYGRVSFDTEVREHVVVGYDKAHNYQANDPNWPVTHGQSKGSPRSRPRIKDAYESSRFMSPPLKDPYYNTREIGKNNEFSDDDDDVICEDGVCYKRGESKPINHVKQDDYDKEKHRGNSYPLKKDSYYEKPYDSNEKHRGNSHGPSSYTVPVTIPPKQHPYYEPSTHNNNRPLVNGLKPIQTRPSPDFPNENTKNSPPSIGMQPPQYNRSPRYKKAPPTAGAYAADKNKGIKIDAKEAAKKYKGVLLTN